MSALRSERTTPRKHVRSVPEAAPHKAESFPEMESVKNSAETAVK